MRESEILSKDLQDLVIAILSLDVSTLLKGNLRTYQLKQTNILIQILLHPLMNSCCRWLVTAWCRPNRYQWSVSASPDWSGLVTSRALIG